MSIDLSRKDELGNWHMINYIAGDQIELKSINLILSIEQVYEDVQS